MKRITTVIIDTHNDFDVLNEVEEFKDLIRTVDINMDKEPMLNDIYKEGCCNIIPLNGIDDATVQEWLVNYITETLFLAAKKGKVAPFFLVIDEAHKYVPERYTSECKEMIISAVKEGRKFGMGLFLLSQRPASLSKEALSQCNTQITHKVLNKNDLSSIIDSVEGVSNEDKENLKRLDVGEVLITGGGLKTSLYVKVKKKQSPTRDDDLFGVG